MAANKKKRFIPTTNSSKPKVWKSVIRPDSYPSHELNPLAAGDQTLFEKGETAYCLDGMNRFPILNQINN
jgi:hypothetical protein